MPNPKLKIYSAIMRDYDTISQTEHNELDFISPNAYIKGHKQKQTQDICYDYGISNTFYHAMINNKAVSMRSFFCLAQVNGYVIAPLGKLYPCWEVLGDDSHMIGKLKSDTVQWNSEVLKQWRTFDITKREKCSKCKYALFCGGGCPAHAMSGKNVHCNFFKGIFNHAINRAYRKYINNLLTI